jgi:hypothetical protein
MGFNPSDWVTGGGRPNRSSSSIRMGKDGFDITFQRGSSRYVVSGYHLFMLRRVKDEFNVPVIFTRKFKGIPFSILYDFDEKNMYMVTLGVRRKVVESIFGGVEGLEFEHLSECLDEDIDPKTLWKYIAFPLPEHLVERSDTQRSLLAESKFYYNPESLADVYNAMKEDKAKMLVSFIPASEAELERERAFYERELKVVSTGGYTRKEKKVSRLALLGNAIASQFTSVPYKDLSKGAIYEEERYTDVQTTKLVDVRRQHIAHTIVAMCDNAKLINDAIFRVAFIGYGENSDLLEMHFHSKFPCLKEPVSLTEELTFGIPQHGGDVMSGLFASNFIYFPKNYSAEGRESSTHPMDSFESFHPSLKKEERF